MAIAAQSQAVEPLQVEPLLHLEDPLRLFDERFQRTAQLGGRQLHDHLPHVS